MDTGVLVSIILGASSVVSSLISSVFFGFIPNRRKQENENLKGKVVTLTQDIDSFREIEAAYIALLSEQTGENKKSLKIRIRKEISDKTKRTLSVYTQPCMIKKTLENLKQN